MRKACVIAKQKVYGQVLLNDWSNVAVSQSYFCIITLCNIQLFSGRFVESFWIATHCWETKNSKII